VQFLDSHISTRLNKDTRDLFMLCIVVMCQLYRVVFIIVVRVFCSLLDFHSSFVVLVVLEVPVHHYLCKSINIIRQTAPTLS
jgi:hypothetical protein